MTDQNTDDDLTTAYMLGRYDGRKEAERNQALSSADGSLNSLIKKWEACAKSWMKLAEERSEDPDLADRAAARAAIYQDCANELKENAEDERELRHEEKGITWED